MKIPNMIMKDRKGKLWTMCLQFISHPSPTFLNGFSYTFVVVSLALSPIIRRKSQTIIFHIQLKEQEKPRRKTIIKKNYRGGIFYN